MKYRTLERAAIYIIPLVYSIKSFAVGGLDAGLRALLLLAASFVVGILLGAMPIAWGYFSVPKWQVAAGWPAIGKLIRAGRDIRAMRDSRARLLSDIDPKRRSVAPPQ